MNENSIFIVIVIAVILGILAIRLLRRLIYLIVATLMTFAILSEIIKEPYVNFTQILPDLKRERYTAVDSQKISQYVVGIGELYSRLGGVPGTLKIGNVPSWVRFIGRNFYVAKCYQERGALGARFYYNTVNHSKFGIITFVDQDKLINLENFAACISPLIQEEQRGRESVYASGKQGSQICANYYVMQQNMNTIHVAYIGSTHEVCREFCRNLKDCR